MNRVLVFAAAGLAISAIGPPPSALTPPRGWNSYDSFTWKVSEAAFLENCAAVAAMLRPSGYDYCVVDYLWFQDLQVDSADNAATDEGSGSGHADGAYSGADRAALRERAAPLRDPITNMHIDAHGRLVPAPDRWPSTWSVDGKTSLGFAPIAAKVHALGMKFGIHIMRGISIAAVNARSPVLGMEQFTAADVANQTSESLCPWWKGVMSVNMSHPAGQAYFDSLYAQYYDDWRVDFIKNDCVFGNQFVPDQIRANAASIRSAAARQPGRAPIVYSLSPGGGIAPNGKQDLATLADQISGDVNMYRVTGDDWDNWPAVDAHFGVAAIAANSSLVGAPGLGAPGSRSWPDLDMLPFGIITSPNAGPGTKHKNTSLTADQQYAQMTLWAIARSPLMFGGVATQLDAFTLALLTNAEVLALNADGRDNRPVRTIAGGSDAVAWGAALSGGKTYVALFKGNSSSSIVAVALSDLGLGAAQSCDVWNVWSAEAAPAGSCANSRVTADVPQTGVVLYRLTKCA